MSETWRDLGGGSTDPNTRPDCSWNCDGMGYDRHTDARTRGPVPCLVHWPETPTRPVRHTRRLRVAR